MLLLKLMAPEFWHANINLVLNTVRKFLEVRLNTVLSKHYLSSIPMISHHARSTQYPYRDFHNHSYQAYMTVVSVMRFCLLCYQSSKRHVNIVVNNRRLPRVHINYDHCKVFVLRPSTVYGNIRMGTDGCHGDFIVLPHWVIRLPAPYNLLSHSVTLYRHWASQSLPYPSNAERQARKQQI